MQDVRSTDWSEEVAPFWKAVIQTALSGAGFAGLMRAGWTTIKVGCRGCFEGVAPRELKRVSQGQAGGLLLPIRLTLPPLTCTHLMHTPCATDLARPSLREGPGSAQGRLCTCLTPSARLPCLPCAPPQGALVMPLMAQGFQMGLIKFNLITAQKSF